MERTGEAFWVRGDACVSALTLPDGPKRNELKLSGDPTVTFLNGEDTIDSYGQTSVNIAYQLGNERLGRSEIFTRESPRQLVTLSDFRAAAHKKFGPMADEFLKLYPASDDEAAPQNNEAIHDNSQISTYLWARQWTRDTGKPMYTYWWAHATPGPDHDTRGAYHGSEIFYVFNSLDKVDLPWTDEDRRIADMMSSYWANYAKTGDPNGSGLPSWPRFDAKTPQVMVLGDGVGPVPIAQSQKFDFWTRFFATNEAW